MLDQSIMARINKSDGTSAIQLERLKTKLKIATILLLTCFVMIAMCSVLKFRMFFIQVYLFYVCISYKLKVNSRKINKHIFKNQIFL